MAYITRADIEAIYGAAFLALLAPPGSDLDAVTGRAADLASGEADLYLSRRYAVPLPLVPDGLKIAVIDLACYRLAAGHDRLTEEVAERARAARKLLEAIAAGKAGLGTAEPSGATEPPGENGASSEDGSYFSARARLFGR